MLEKFIKEERSAIKKGSRVEGKETADSYSGNLREDKGRWQTGSTSRHLQRVREQTRG